MPLVTAQRDYLISIKLHSIQLAMYMQTGVISLR